MSLLPTARRSTSISSSPPLPPPPPPPPARAHRDSQERERALDERESSLVERENELQARRSLLEEERRALLREKRRLGLLAEDEEEALEEAEAGELGDGAGPSSDDASADGGRAAGDGDDGDDDAAALEGYPDSGDVPVPPGGACYLVYESDSSGRLVERYSKSGISGAIGRWTTCGQKGISGFKFKNTKGNVVIAGCSGGTQGRRNYFSGWCQFVRAACHMESVVMMWDPPEGKKGLPVDVWVYTNDNRPGHQSVRLRPGIGRKTSGVLAIACLPKGTQFYDQITIDINKWFSEGSSLGGCLKV